MKVSCVCGDPAVCLMQTGSAFILMSAFFGATPSSETTPLISPAAAASTFFPPPAGAGAGAEVVDVEPPPHATDAASANPNPYTQSFRRRMDLISWRKNMLTSKLVKATFNHTLEASTCLRNVDGTGQVC